MHTYHFYWDDKYHWIIRTPTGDRVMDPELWAKLLNRDAMIDGMWYLGTDVVDPIYGEMHLCIEIAWLDGMPRTVSLTAPDGDPIKRDLKRFHITSALSL